jgi:hypothetical protein
MMILRWLWEGIGYDEVPPAVAYWMLRTIMFTLSFVLEDWAIYELIRPIRRRRLAVLLVASSYVTWTFQTHTFSNSIETLLVLWSLVLVERIVENKVRHHKFEKAYPANSAAAFRNSRILRTCILIDTRNLQPDYIPRVRIFTMSETSTSLLEKVCSCHGRLFYYDSGSSHLLNPDLHYCLRRLRLARARLS